MFTTTKAKVGQYYSKCFSLHVLCQGLHVTMFYFNLVSTMVNKFQYTFTNTTYQKFNFYA